jgi:hypothetical protein
LIAIVLLALTLPVMGQVTFTGEVKGGFYQPIQDKAGASAINASGKLAAAFKADDNVSGTITTQLSSGTAVLDTCNASINLLPAFGVKDVPLAMTLTVGKTDTGNAGVVDYTHYGFEKVIGLGTTGGFDNMKLDTKIMDLVTVRTGIAPATYNGDSLVQFAVGAFGTVAPISAEIFYGNSKHANGDVGIGLGFNQAFGDLTVKAGGTTQIPLIDKAVIAWGAGTAISYTTLAKLTASVKGNIGTDQDVLGAVGIGLESTPTTLVTLKAGLTLDTSKNANSVLDGIELATQFNLGKYSLVVGYNYTGKAAGSTVIKNDAFVGKSATPGSNGGIGIQSSVTF